MWLTDFLPLEIENARIMTYGYNSQLVENTVNMTIGDYKKELVQILHNARISNKVHPLAL